MLRLIQTCILFLTVPLALFSQNFDEKAFLKSLPKTKNDSNKVNKLLNYCDFLKQNNGSLKALAYADTTIRLSKKIKFPKGEIAAQELKSSLFFEANDFENALATDKKRLEIYQSLDQKENIALAKEAIGTDFAKLNKSDSAMCYFKMALENYKASGNKQGLGRTNGVIGNIYLVKQDYGKALTFAKESLKFYEELKDKSGMRDAYTDLMHIYNEIGNTPAAKDYEQRISRINKEMARQ